MTLTRAAAAAALLALFCLSPGLAQCATGQNCTGAGHQAHAVPGADVTVFDVDGNGEQTVSLDGSLSHSHYFQAGPPVVNGQIVKYEWKKTSDGVVVCTEVKCNVSFPVGVTEVQLTVTDQTGDAASDVIVITVKDGAQATGVPTVSGIQPTTGSSAGGTLVTISGSNFYEGSSVTFGGVAATSVTVVGPGLISATAPPGGPGGVEVVVTTAVGSGGGVTFTYQGAGGGGPVAWTATEWKNPDGSTWKDAQEVTGITIGPDGRYYMSTLTGKVWAVDVGPDLVVKSACSGAQFEAGRSLYGIAWNPKDGANRLLVTSNIMYWKDKGGTWDNAEVVFVNIDANGGCVSIGDKVITGLPMSNHDHGPSKMAFDGGDGMLLSSGGTTNAGIPSDALGGIDESPLSGAVLYAPYLSPGFNGAIKYSSNDPGTTNVVSGDVTVYSAGFRNIFGMIKSSKGQYYCTDNGPNANFGATSTGCTTQSGDANTQDTLHKFVKGEYHGHPNRNRGRTDPKQCVWRQNEIKPIGEMPSSTNGIVEYTANTFGGQIKGDLFLSKLAINGNPGITFQVNLDGDGNAKGNPFEVWGASGEQVVMSPEGFLVMPQLKYYKVLVLKPASSGTVRMLADGVPAPEVHAVFPPKGRWEGGNAMIVTGRGFRDDTVVRVAGRECEYLELRSPTQMICQVPAGRGMGHVTATTAGIISPVFGTHDYEWI